jgi:acetyl-CoA carboxylase biotin carboxyl carrier protein
MRREEIEDLIRIVEESKINELEICEGKKKIRIAKGGVGSSGRGAADVGPQESVSNPHGGISPNPGETEKLAPNLKEIRSPMVGTFYSAPAPDAEPFVDVGQVVEVGQTVCIVEAMKLMNEIGSDFKGVIQKVVVENGQPVEFGQPLFLVDPR